MCAYVPIFLACFGPNCVSTEKIMKFVIRWKQLVNIVKPFPIEEKMVHLACVMFSDAIGAKEYRHKS